jgi:hypothetical protein
MLLQGDIEQQAYGPDLHEVEQVPSALERQYAESVQQYVAAQYGGERNRLPPGFFARGDAKRGRERQ